MSLRRKSGEPLADLELRALPSPDSLHREKDASRPSSISTTTHHSLTPSPPAIFDLFLPSIPP